MKKNLFFILLLSALNIIIGQETLIKESDLLGCWKFYPEESKIYPDMTLYRPCGYQSLPRRFMRYRFKMELMENGKCRYLKVGATDSHFMNDAKWTFEPESSILTIMTGSVIKKMKLVHVEKDLLGASKS